MTGLVAPTHCSIRKYYEGVAALRAQGVLSEMSVRSPFESLLQETARLKDWTFVAEISGKFGGAPIRPAGTRRDRNSLPSAIIVPILSGPHYKDCKDFPSRGRCEVSTRDTVRFFNAWARRRCLEAERGRDFKYEIA